MMARRLRLKIPGQAAAYHIVTRTRGRDFLFDPTFKGYFLKLLGQLQSLYYVRYAAFSILDNHYHLLLCFDDPEDVDALEAVERWNTYHAGSVFLRNASLEAHRLAVVQALTDVSDFMKRFNHHMSMAFNRRNGSSGTLWASRFHSSVVERGFALLACAAYIELNAFRASLTARPEDYPFCSLHHLTRPATERGLVAAELLAEGLGCDLDDRDELVRGYQAYVYAVGTDPHRQQADGIVVTPAMQTEIDRLGLKPQPGSMTARIGELIGGIVTGSLEYVRRVYNIHVAPGVAFERRAAHMQRWVQGTVQGLWSACSTFGRGP